MVTFSSPCSLWLSWVGSWRCLLVETAFSGDCGAPWTRCNAYTHSTRCPGYGYTPEDMRELSSSSWQSAAAAACPDFCQICEVLKSLLKWNTVETNWACMLSYSIKSSPTARCFVIMLNKHISHWALTVPYNTVNKWDGWKDDFLSSLQMCTFTFTYCNNRHRVRL